MNAYKTNRSLSMHQERMRFLPAGRHSNYLNEDTISELTFLCGCGSRLWDADHNEYLDLCGRQGAQFLGHSHPDFTQIVTRSFDSVLSVSHTPLDTEVCSYLQEHVPCCEKVRFGLSGSETILNAIRLARAYTGKKIILKFKGHYHGSSDALLYADDESLYQITWNSMEQLEGFYRTHPDIAAIITEPLCMSSGGVPAQPEYLNELRSFCTSLGILLIFDEVITGVRTGLGGLQAKYAVTPDLCVYAKGISNGIPISALMGKNEIMQLYEVHQVVQGGTHNGHQLGLAAVKATFQIILGMSRFTFSAYEKRCQILCNLLIAAGEKAGVPVSVQGEPGCYAVNCSTQKLTEIAQWSPELIRKNAILRCCLQRYGILMATVCRAYPNLMLTDNDLDFLEAHSAAAFSEAKKILNKWF